MLLNCLDYNTTIQSLENILKVNTDRISEFLDQCRFKVTVEGPFRSFERIEMHEIKEFFNIDQFDFNEVVVHHVAAIINKESYYRNGILNLENLATTDNSFSEFLAQYDISLKINPSGTIYIMKDGKEIGSEYTAYRFSKDQCINGFLLGESALIDTNVKYIRRCPELISHIGRVIIRNSEIERNWTERAIPSLISFRVPIEQIDATTFHGELEYHEKQEFFIIKALEYLLLKQTDYGIENPMIFLKEKATVPPENIISIDELYNKNTM